MACIFGNFVTTQLAQTRKAINLGEIIGKAIQSSSNATPMPLRDFQHSHEKLDPSQHQTRGDHPQHDIGGVTSMSVWSVSLQGSSPRRLPQSSHKRARHEPVCGSHRLPAGAETVLLSGYLPEGTIKRDSGATLAPQSHVPARIRPAAKAAGAGGGTVTNASPFARLFFSGFDVLSFSWRKFDWRQNG